jgi:hypothetical protein
MGIAVAVRRHRVVRRSRVRIAEEAAPLEFAS